MTRSFYVIGSVVFVPHPVAYGYWFRTDIAVIKVACPECHSDIGVPCFARRSGRTGVRDYTAATHYHRRMDAKRVDLPRRGETVTITIQRPKPRRKSK